MTTLAEIEKAADALPPEEQAALLRHLGRKVARAGNGLMVPPPKVPVEEIERIEAIIDAEFSQVESCRLVMLLDTNAISALSKPDAGLLRILRNDHPWFLPSIALGEFRFGLMSSLQGEELNRWLNEMEAACEVLSPDATTARHYAEIRHALTIANTPIPWHDIWIAALAVQHGLALVTRDAHFARVSQVRCVGWEPIRPR